MQLALVELTLLEQNGVPGVDIPGLGLVLPRVWDLTTIADPELLHEVWAWLARFVEWLNTQHAWFSSDLTPPCWAQHPSLIHQLASLAAARHLAGEATDVTALEDWHRYGLPSYLERTREQRHGCAESHQPWPGRAALNRSRSENPPSRVGAGA